MTASTIFSSTTPPAPALGRSSGRAAVLLALLILAPVLASCTTYESNTRVERRDDDRYDYPDDHGYYEDVYYGKREGANAYQYYPDCDVYYHRGEHVYMYPGRGHWNRVKSLPPGLARKCREGRYVIVHMEGDRPERWHNDVRRDYDRGRWNSSDRDNDRWRDRNDDDDRWDRDRDRDRNDRWDSDKGDVRRIKEQDKQQDKKRAEADRRYVKPNDDRDNGRGNGRNKDTRSGLVDARSRGDQGRASDKAAVDPRKRDEKNGKGADARTVKSSQGKGKKSSDVRESGKADEAGKSTDARNEQSTDPESSRGIDAR